MSGKIHGSFLSVIVYDGKICAKTASAIIQGYASGLWRGYMFRGRRRHLTRAQPCRGALSHEDDV